MSFKVPAVPPLSTSSFDLFPPNPTKRIDEAADVLSEIQKMIEKRELMQEYLGESVDPEVRYELKRVDNLCVDIMDAMYDNYRGRAVVCPHNGNGYYAIMYRPGIGSNFVERMKMTVTLVSNIQDLRVELGKEKPYPKVLMDVVVESKHEKTEITFARCRRGDYGIGGWREYMNEYGCRLPIREASDHIVNGISNIKGKQNPILVKRIYAVCV